MRLFNVIETVLNERVSDLSTQVLSLSEQLRRLSGN